MQIDQERLWQSHLDLARIGTLPGGGCCRLALTDEDRAARDLFVKWCCEIGCRVSFDRVGNIFSRRAGAQDDLPPVACGSHLDTQPHGGRFDGISGVLGGLEVFRALTDHKVVTKRPLELIVWTNEEGVRFSPGLLGSSVFAGRLPIETALGTLSRDGVPFAKELSRIGYAGEEAVGAHPLDSYFELHVEQGPILEHQKKRIGVVTGVQGIRWLEIEVAGQDNHAGTTPLNLRKDAILAAAQLVCHANEIGLRSGLDARVTVGRLDITPNSPSTIPGSARLLVDFRHPETATMDSIEEQLRAAASKIADATGTGISPSKTLDAPPVKFDAACVAAVQAAAERQGRPFIRMLSGAAHDAMRLASITPTAMIFVPSKGGLSHTESEYSSPEDLAGGCQVLMDAVLSRAIVTR